MATTRDIIRQIIVLVSAIAAVIGAFYGSGAAGGTPVEQQAGGALSADATPIAPAGPAFSIWSVIYLGLLAYAVWQLIPRNRTDPRQRRLGYLVAASMLLNAAWILSIQADLLPLSVPIIAALLVVLVLLFRICLDHLPRTVLESIVADGTVGLYLGWVVVATAANVTAWLTAAGFDGLGISPDVWAVAVILLAGAVGVLIAVRGAGRISPALSLCWGLGWLAYARLTGDLVSVPAAVAAIVAAVVVAAVTAFLRVRAERTRQARPQLAG
jgi:hypothetical protein